MNNKKRTLLDIIRQEKEMMLPINAFFSYTVAPIYMLISLILIAVFGILMSIDDKKYLLPGVLCLGAVGVITIALLCMVPFVRKKAIEAEMERYDFDFSGEPALETWDFSNEENAIRFKSCGMYVDDNFYNFDELTVFVVTGNYCRRVHILLRLMINPYTYVDLALDKPVLKMIETFRIKICNRALFDYILANKKAAFAKIYDKGYVLLQLKN